MSLGDNTSVKIVGKDNLSLDGKNHTKDVLYIEGLKHNLLRISQMCDRGYKFTFDSKGCKIKKNGKIVGQGSRTNNNLYNLC